MKYEQACHYISALAEGRDPKSGENFPMESLYQQPDIIRAMCTAKQALELQNEQERKRAGQPSNYGQPWTEEEEQRLVQAFDTGKHFPEIAAEHSRSVGAIKARLVKLGKIEDDSPRYRI